MVQTRSRTIVNKQSPSNAARLRPRWSDKVLDEDIDYLRDKYHDYGTLLKERVILREVREHGFFGEGLGEPAVNLNHVVERFSNFDYRDTPHYSHNSPIYEHFVDYEDALVARYATHKRNQAPSKDRSRPHWRQSVARGHPRAIDFDSHVEDMSEYDEQDWINVLGFHPVDLPKTRTKFASNDYGVLNYLENKLMKTIALEKTSDIRQQRLDKLNLNLIEGATNFVQILDKTKLRNPSHHPSQPRDHKLNYEDERALFENARLMGSEHIRDVAESHPLRDGLGNHSVQYPLFNFL